MFQCRERLQEDFYGANAQEVSTQNRFQCRERLQEDFYRACLPQVCTGRGSFNAANGYKRISTREYSLLTALREVSFNAANGYKRISTRHAGSRRRLPTSSCITIVSMPRTATRGFLQNLRHGQTLYHVSHRVSMPRTATRGFLQEPMMFALSNMRAGGFQCRERLQEDFYAHDVYIGSRVVAGEFQCRERLQEDFYPTQ